MRKFLEIHKGGYTFQVDLDAVAKSRAEYYGKNDPEPDYDTTYKSEYEFTMTDNYEAIDWFQNNMNWSDIPDDNKRIIKSPEPPKATEDIEYDDDVEITISEAT